MSDTLNINEILENLPIVNPTRQYWLVRTSSGDYYEEFKHNGYIAIGWNEIPVADLASIHANETNEEVRNRVKSKVHVEGDPEHDRGARMSQSKAIGQLLKFAYEIKRGDIVVIPSSNSDYLSFGEVEDTPIYIDNSGNCDFTKRKRVSWIKTDIRRLSLDSNLYRFIFAHQTINNVNEYAEYINSTLFDFYTLNGRSSLVLRVRRQEAFDSFRIGVFYSDLLFFMKEFSEENGQEVNPGDINVKLDLQSPGTIVFFGVLATALVCLGVMTILAGGEGGLEIDPATQKIKFNFKSNSFFEKFSDFLDRKQERTIRLMRELQHFQVEENRNLGSLIEPLEEKSDNDAANDAEDDVEV